MQLVDFDYINQNEEALTQRFLSCRSVKKYILGINKLTKSVLRHVEEVIKNFPDFQKIYLIEPIAENIRIAKRELGHYENIEFLACGISNKKATLHFNEEKSFSTLYGTGTQSIEVNTIDALVKERVDFIKLDIEGAEQDAIDGAKETIEKYKPILAICIYHRAEDWYKIPQKVLALESGYRVYLRHYMEGIFESVMYFIPEK